MFSFCQKNLSPERSKSERAENRTVKSSDFGIFPFSDDQFSDIHCNSPMNLGKTHNLL